MHEPARPSVLIVEDEFLIADALRLQLERQGAHVIGPVARVSAALELIASGQHIDCAMLDVKLAGEPVFPVADALRARGVRVAFISCYDRSALPPAYRDATYFSKLEDPKAMFRWVLGT
jgi:DNA-binding response OmpR family regulator